MSDMMKQSRWNALKSVFGVNKAEAPAPDAPAIPASAISPGSEGDQVRDDQARLAALYRVSRTLGSSLELDEVLNQVMDAVIELTGAERGILVMVESESGNWSLRVSRNFAEEKLNEWEKEVSRTIINAAIETRTGVVTADAMSDPRFSTQASVVFNVLRSTMCTPLLARGRVIGAIYIDSRIQKGIFNDEDLEMLDAFATQAAFAIDNARIYTRTVEKLQQLTIELDEVRKDRQVAEITETEYFQQLQARVGNLRQARKKSEDQQVDV